MRELMPAGSLAHGHSAKYSTQSPVNLYDAETRTIIALLSVWTVSLCICWAQLSPSEAVPCPPL